MTLARELVRAVRAVAKAPLPEEAALAARLHLLDAIGVGLAAAGSPIGAAYRGFAAETVKGGPATVFGQSTGASAADAALINGGLIHSLEFDDTHTASIAHGSAVLAAGALAVAEAQNANGAALLGAYARGWEVLIRFGLAAPNGFHAKGFMSTSVTGTLAVALLAAELMGLDEERTVAAVGIALSQSSGVMEFLTNGSSVKSLHPGWAAHGGVVAAMLARSGMTGPETSLDGKHGLFRQFTGDEAAAGRFRALIGGLGREWHLPKAAYKFYPCCHYLHPFIEAASKLAERGVRPGDVEHIVCRVPQGEAAVICEPWERKQAPDNGHAARWSLPIAVAAQLVEGKVDLATFEAPAGAAVRKLAQRIAWEPLPGARFPERFEAEVVCKTGSGTQQIRIDDVFGNHTRPPGADAVLSKFRANAARSLKSDAVGALERAAQDLGAARDLKALSAALRSTGQTAESGA
ncbi:MAG TPA: MmgE/PrpD family protein [Steroidobacteraceae bacterium]|nr:MmgE/PrpD family protein [Steroidobacteraceae bacterium]